MEAIMPYLWIAVIVLSVIVEVFTTSLVAIWFVPSAIVAVVLSFCNVDVWIQTLVWMILSISGIILVKTVFKRHFEQKPKKTNLDLIIGERAVVIERIENLSGCGQVKVRGQVWTARAVDEYTVFEEGSTVTIIAIEGVKLICK